MKKVLILGGGPQYARMFVELGFELVTSVEEADLIQFTGGEDVTPKLYGEPSHRQTFNNPYRDGQEKRVYELARKLGKKCAGICRGGQFLNVMNGGKMYQHILGHAIHGTHPATDAETGQVYEVTSTHHQMMIPATNGDVILFADICVSRDVFEDGYFVTKKGKIPTGDVEAIMYEDTDTLCFQPHPEHNGADECKRLYANYLNRLFGEEVCAV